MPSPKPLNRNATHSRDFSSSAATSSQPASPVTTIAGVGLLDGDAPNAGESNDANRRKSKPFSLSPFVEKAQQAKQRQNTRSLSHQRGSTNGGEGDTDTERLMASPSYPSQFNGQQQSNSNSNGASRSNSQPRVAAGNGSQQQQAVVLPPLQQQQHTQNSAAITNYPFFSTTSRATLLTNNTAGSPQTQQRTLSPAPLLVGGGVNGGSSSAPPSLYPSSMVVNATAQQHSGKVGATPVMLHQRSHSNGRGGEKDSSSLDPPLLAICAALDKEVRAINSLNNAASSSSSSSFSPTSSFSPFAKSGGTVDDGSAQRESALRAAEALYCVHASSARAALGEVFAFDNNNHTRSVTLKGTTACFIRDLLSVTMDTAEGYIHQLVASSSSSSSSSSSKKDAALLSSSAADDALIAALKRKVASLETVLDGVDSADDLRAALDSLKEEHNHLRERLAHYGAIKREFQVTLKVLGDELIKATASSEGRIRSLTEEVVRLRAEVEGYRNGSAAAQLLSNLTANGGTNDALSMGNTAASTVPPPSSVSYSFPSETVDRPAGEA